MFRRLLSENIVFFVMLITLCRFQVRRRIVQRCRHPRCTRGGRRASFQRDQDSPPRHYNQPIGVRRGRLVGGQRPSRQSRYSGKALSLFMEINRGRGKSGGHYRRDPPCGEGVRRRFRYGNATRSFHR